MASQLIDSMTTKWNPESYKDEFRSKLRRIIDDQIARQSGKKVKAPRAAEETEARRRYDERRGFHGASEAQPGKERTGRRGAQEPAQDVRNGAHAARGARRPDIEVTSDSVTSNL